jgi:hypothetical protein
MKLDTRTQTFNSTTMVDYAFGAVLRTLVKVTSSNAMFMMGLQRIL